MDEYYHFTEYKNLESISRDGLLPHNGERSISISDSRNIICLSKGKTSAIIMFMALKSFYEHYAGKVGDKLLKDLKNSNEDIRKQISNDIFDLENKLFKIYELFPKFLFIDNIKKFKKI